MDKPILYCDCDGVILNTIEVSFKIMEELGCNINNRSEVDAFFRNNIDWNEVFSRIHCINNSFEQLKLIKSQGIFRDIIILTKLSGGYDEERLKRDLFKDVLPDFKVITLQYGLVKGLVVSAKDNVLVDDEIGNCRKWEKENGVAILFSPYMYNFDINVINNIGDVVNTMGVKKLLKTRNI